MTRISKFILFILLLCIFDVNSQVFNDVTVSKNITEVSSITQRYGLGASIADYDNDGDLDFLLGTDFRVANRLYQNSGDGSFIEIANSVGINVDYRNRASLWFDYNGDTLLDLVLLGDCYFEGGCVNLAEIFVYKQNIDHTFTLMTETGIEFGDKYNINDANLTTEVLAGGLAAGDINNDGWLDLIVTIWGAPLSLFLNNGNETFTDISQSSNMGVTTFSRHQPVFHDFDYDGFLDIYINIDFTENEFWKNNGNNTFIEIAGSLNANNDFNEMGMAVGDYDNDGDFDIYSTNITRGDGEEMGYNIFLKNNWSGTNILSFTEVANDANFNVGESGWDWGTTFFDANNDGYLDLATTNGWEDNNWVPDQSRLWLNVDGLLFSDISTASGFNDTWNASSLLAFDMDRDGDLDLLQTMRQNGSDRTPLRLYENNVSTSSESNYLVIKPRMNGNNHFAIGAVVKIVYDGGTKTATRLITAGISFYGQEPAEAFFGLAENIIVDEVRIEWPDNTVTVVDDVTANQVITVTNDNTLDIENGEITEVKAYPNPVNSIIYLENSSLIKEVQVFNLLGQQIIQKDFNSESIKLNLMALNSGSYFIKVIDNNNPVGKTIRIIKQ